MEDKPVIFPHYDCRHFQERPIIPSASKTIIDSDVLPSRIMVKDKKYEQLILEVKNLKSKLNDVESELVKKNQIIQSLMSKVSEAILSTPKKIPKEVIDAISTPTKPIEKPTKSVKITKTK